MGQAKSKAAQPRMALTFPGDPDHGSMFSFFSTFSSFFFIIFNLRNY